MLTYGDNGISVLTARVLEAWIQQRVGYGTMHFTGPTQQVPQMAGRLSEAHAQQALQTTFSTPEDEYMYYLIQGYGMAEQTAMDHILHLQSTEGSVAVIQKVIECKKLNNLNTASEAYQLSRDMAATSQQALDRLTEDLRNTLSAEISGRFQEMTQGLTALNESVQSRTQGLATKIDSSGMRVMEHQAKLTTAQIGATVASHAMQTKTYDHTYFSQSTVGRAALEYFGQPGLPMLPDSQLAGSSAGVPSPLPGFTMTGQSAQPGTQGTPAPGNMFSSKAASASYWQQAPPQGKPTHAFGPGATLPAGVQNAPPVPSAASGAWTQLQATQGGMPNQPQGASWPTSGAQATSAATSGAALAGQQQPANMGPGGPAPPPWTQGAPASGFWASQGAGSYIGTQPAQPTGPPPQQAPVQGPNLGMMPGYPQIFGGSFPQVMQQPSPNQPVMPAGAQQWGAASPSAPPAQTQAQTAQSWPNTWQSPAPAGQWQLGLTGQASPAPHAQAPNWSGPGYQGAPPATSWTGAAGQYQPQGQLSGSQPHQGPGKPAKALKSIMVPQDMVQHRASGYNLETILGRCIPISQIPETPQYRRLMSMNLPAKDYAVHLSNEVRVPQQVYGQLARALMQTGSVGSQLSEPARTTLVFYMTRDYGAVLNYCMANYRFNVEGFIAGLEQPY